MPARVLKYTLMPAMLFVVNTTSQGFWRPQLPYSLLRSLRSTFSLLTYCLTSFILCHHGRRLLVSPLQGVSPYISETFDWHWVTESWMEILNGQRRTNRQWGWTRQAYSLLGRTATKVEFGLQYSVTLTIKNNTIQAENWTLFHLYMTMEDIQSSVT